MIVTTFLEVATDTEYVFVKVKTAIANCKLQIASSNEMPVVNGK